MIVIPQRRVDNFSFMIVKHVSVLSCLRSCRDNRDREDILFILRAAHGTGVLFA
jgi:hypothetical protein